jgi:two-component system, OmpR family, response regulator RpaB
MIADDEDSIRKVLKTRLSLRGYSVLTAADGQETLDIFDARAPDLLVLDIMMPRLDGYAVCETLREKSAVPIIMLTALSDVADRIFGLKMGADDYMVKPFSPNELEARIDCILRRVKRPTNNRESKAGVLEVGRLRIDPNKRQVYREGERIGLTEMEFNILELLSQYQGKTVSRLEIVQQVWGISSDTLERCFDSRVVDVQVSRLRLKLEKDPSNSEFILTVRGDGYRFGLGTPLSA